MDQVIDRLDESGKCAWLVAMILGFVVFWPIGLTILFYMIWSGRMGNWNCSGRGSWQQGSLWMDQRSNNGERRSRRRSGRRHHHRHSSQSSGNHAFDTYREETLQRLEEEQQEFEGFLERLRQAKDKEEFDQFMAERRDKPEEPPEEPESEDDKP